MDDSKLLHQKNREPIFPSCYNWDCALLVGVIAGVQCTICFRWKKIRSSILARRGRKYPLLCSPTPPHPIYSFNFRCNLPRFTVTGPLISQLQLLKMGRGSTKVEGQNQVGTSLIHPCENWCKLYLQLKKGPSTVLCGVHLATSSALSTAVSFHKFSLNFSEVICVQKWPAVDFICTENEVKSPVRLLEPVHETLWWPPLQLPCTENLGVYDHECGLYT